MRTNENAEGGVEKKNRERKELVVSVVVNCECKKRTVKILPEQQKQNLFGNSVSAKVE